MKNYFYIIYKITCTEGELKDHYYIGRHRTTNINDGYKGSGNKIREYYKKYPNSYKKEILCYCNSYEELEEAESRCIKPHLNDDLCLNLNSGGAIGIMANEVKQRISNSLKNRIMINKDGCTKHVKQCELNDYLNNGWNLGVDINYVTKEHKLNISKSLSGRTLSTEHKKHISESTKGKQKLKGKIWVHNNSKRTLINKDCINTYISNGYSLGMGKLK